MVSKFCSIILLLVSTCVNSSTKFGNTTYGLGRANLAAYWVCWLEKFDRSSYGGSVEFQDCRDKNNYVRILEDLYRRVGSREEKETESLLAEREMFVSFLNGTDERGLRDYLLNGIKGDIYKSPDINYSSLLWDSAKGNYPYRGFAYCLFQSAENRNGKEDVSDFLSKYPLEDVKYGLEQATKVVKGTCWLEKLNKPYPKNDGGGKFTLCRNNHKYVELLQRFHDKAARAWTATRSIPFQNEGLHKKNLLKEIEKQILDYLPEYKTCLLFFQATNEAPKNDYGWLLGDRENYPYKAYTHCLLGIIEDRNGQQGLDDLKAKWENSKSLAEVLLQWENEHRTWHKSPAFELDEELVTRAQVWADYLAKEVCEPKNSASRNNFDRKINTTKYGENVSFHSDLSLSDDEIAVMAAVGWYKESELYPWPVFNGSMDVWTKNIVGHFTQSVWKNTERVGYAISRGTEGCQKIFVVARYWPVGNTFWKEEEQTKAAFENNVLPSIK